MRAPGFWPVDVALSRLIPGVVTKVESHGALAKIAKAETPDKALFVQGGPEAARQGFPER